MRADAFGLAEFVTHDVTRQSRVQRLAPAFGTLVAGHIDCVVRFTFFLRRRDLRGRSQRLSLVEEHVFLIGAARLALGGEDLAQEFVQALLEQVMLHAQNAVLAGQ